MANNTLLAVSAAGALVVGASVATTDLTTSSSSGSPTTLTIAAISDADAARLAKQATFGPTAAVIARIKQLGLQGWLDEQFATRDSSFADLAKYSVNRNYCKLTGANDVYCAQKYRTRLLPAMRFYADAVQNEDQLRQRVALALFNMMPVSADDTPAAAGQAAYLQIMLDGAFGNFADLLRNVTLSASMGEYLDMTDSSGKAPNENYARELLQLFSMGDVALNADGSPKFDSTGATIANYTQKDVTEIARAFSGWTSTRFDGSPALDPDFRDLSKPLIPNPTRFDGGAKAFLGTTVAAGASQQQNVDAVIAAVMANPSTYARVSKFLIQQLVKSNPSPAYVARVTATFQNNGSGVTGDLKAVVRKILTDPEARGDTDTSGRAGKLKDPVLLAVSLARVVGLKTDGYAFYVRDGGMGQQFLRPPTVFNNYPADFPLWNAPGMVSPSSKLLTTSMIIGRHNFVWNWTMLGDTGRGEFTTPSWVPGGSGSSEDWSGWEAFGANVDGMIDRINLLMLNNAMTADQRTALKAAMLLVTDPDPTLQARRRAQTGIYVVGASPQFQVDR